MAKRRSHSSRRSHLSAHVSSKVHFILNILLVILALILIRLWQLSVLQHDKRVAEVRQPTRKTIIEYADRGTIRDRFNIPLALNRIQYNVSVLYAQIRQVPAYTWEKDAQGKRIRKNRRKEYITQFAELLADELDLNAQTIEDLIYAKAALHPHQPLTLKQDIDESTYYRLKFLEQEWLGLHVEKSAQRTYPQGEIASHVIGYLGAIGSNEYKNLHITKKELANATQDDLLERERLQELSEKFYSIHDTVGKTGVEAKYEQALRGYYGQATYYSDARGNFLRPLPGGRQAIPGQRLVLTLSAELQAYAEQLLAENEKIRDGRSIQISYDGIRSLKQPWIKGGSIVAIDPHSGEVLALASYPRFDPNDFITTDRKGQRAEQIDRRRKWLETESHIADIWHAKVPLDRELFSSHENQYSRETKLLTWKTYLDTVLPENHPVNQKLSHEFSIGDAMAMNSALRLLLEETQPPQASLLIDALFPPPHHLAIHERNDTDKAKITQILNSKGQLAPAHRLLESRLSEIPSNDDKLLLLDLCRLVVHEERFPKTLLLSLGKQPIADFRQQTNNYVQIGEAVQSVVKELFHRLTFTPWREEHQKDFLANMRKQEQKMHRHAKPYIDYLHKQETQMFNEFWEKHQWLLIGLFLGGKLPPSSALSADVLPYASSLYLWQQNLPTHLSWHHAYKQLSQATARLEWEQKLAYLQSFRKYDSLDRPLLGKYAYLRNSHGVQLEKHLAAAFYPLYGFGYLRSKAYQDTVPQGSIFKVVTAYAALKQLAKQPEHQRAAAPLNPLTMIDQVTKHTSPKESWTVGYTLDNRPIPQFYKGGRLPRSSRRNNGKIDVLGAIEVSSNPYFSLLAGDFLNDPEDLNLVAREFSYGAPTGIDLPREASGNLPKDLSKNRTGLYSYAIGQHALLNTPLQTAVMLASIANGGSILQPRVVKLCVGKKPNRCDEEVLENKTFSFQETLALVGVNFPIFTETENAPEHQLIESIDPIVVRHLFMPPAVRTTLLQAMQRTTQGAHGNCRAAIIRSLSDHSPLMKTFRALQPDFVGKSSTSEVVEHIDLNPDVTAHLYKHIFFGAIAFDHSQPDYGVWSHPELIVVVHLRFGDAGREAAPLATAMIQKWREIKKKQGLE